MIKHITTYIAALITACLIFVGCATNPYTPILDATISLAVGEALARGIHNPADRTVTANYVDYAATVLRSATADTPPEVLSQQILNGIPDSVKQKYPEISLITTTVIVPAYKALYNQYAGKVPQFIAAVNELANDIELGAAPYIGPSSPKVPTAIHKM